MADVPDPLALRHVVVMHRHGDRAPISSHVSSKLCIDETERAYWASQLLTPEDIATLDAAASVHTEDEPKHGGIWPLGQLTRRGMEGMMRRGQALRERYDHFLGDAEPHDVYIVSTNITRTIRSAQSVVRGLFPDAPRFQVHTMAPQFLTPIHSGLEYKAFGLHANAVAHATRPGYGALEAEMKALLAIPDDQALHWTVVRDMLVCRKAHGLPVPDGLHDALYDAACDHNAWEWHLLYSDPMQAQRGFVRGLAEIQAHLESIVEKDIDHRMTIISAHDNTLVALVCALGLQIGNVIPNYGAILAMEIYENTSTNEHFVLMRFEDDTVTFTGETTPMVPFTAMKRRFDSFAATHAATSAL